MTIHIACPHCRKPLRIPGAAESATVQCPHCHGLARVPKLSASEPQAPQPAANPPPPPRDPALNPWAGITAMVVGILGLLIACFPMCGVPLCLLAIIFGWIGLAQYKTGRGMATAGLVLGICGIVLSIVVTIGVLALPRLETNEHFQQGPAPPLSRMTLTPCDLAKGGAA